MSILVWLLMWLCIFGNSAFMMIFINKGGLAEQFVGQQIRSSQSPLMDPALFYWQKTGGRQGEIDYIIHNRNCIMPVEIKSE